MRGLQTYHRGKYFLSEPKEESVLTAVNTEGGDLD